MGGARRCDRRDGPDRRLDPRDGVLAVVRPVRVSRATSPRPSWLPAGLTDKTAEAKNYPSLDRAISGLYPPGSTFKPVTALAAMQEHMLSPYAYLPCTGTYSAPEDRSHRTFHNWDPNVDQAMDLPTALAYSCDTYFYRVGNDFYELPSRPRPAAAEVGGDASASARRPVSTSVPRRAACSRPRPGSTARTRPAPTPATGRSTGSGSPATRSSSRSARATCSSRRCR